MQATIEAERVARLAKMLEQAEAAKKAAAKEVGLCPPHSARVDPRSRPGRTRVRPRACTWTPE